MTDTSRAPDRRVAIVAFYDSERRILLQDRRGMAKAGEEWGFFGGGMEPGESPRRAAAREIAEELAYAVPDPVPVGVRSSPLPDGRVVERHVFAAPLPPDWRVRFAQRGWAGMELFALAAARKLRMVPGDDGVLDLAAAYFDRPPTVFVSCSLSLAPMEFVRDMLEFQRSLACVCRTNSWSVDVTARPPANESADLSRAIFEHDSAGIRGADAVVAELSYPSTGSGIELGIAAERGIPILLLARAGSRVSPFVRGMPDAVYREYQDPNELIDLVRTHLLPRIRLP